MEKNPEAQWFGYKEVHPQDKASLVGDVFDSVADRYDLMNDLMSGGIHRLWKDKFVRKIRPHKGQKFLDVAGGTGDIAFRIHQKTGSDSDVTICDINPQMLEVGKARAIDRGYLNRFEWIVGNAESLPMENSSYDVYTISFGLRNVPHIDDALREAYRVLKPGGRFYCLEFSHVEEGLFSKIYDFFSFNVIPKIGKAVAKDSESYQYLVESIRQFPDQENLKSRMEQAGFSHVGYENLSRGIAAIHTGWKL